jgi:hypothetical protein
VSGIVRDESDAAISGAEAVLTRNGESSVQSMLTGVDGRFTFHALLPGSYGITVHAAGFQPFMALTFVLAEGEAYQLPRITLALAGVTTEVVVRPTDVIADQQLKAQEKQRVFGVIPDFYTSYVWNAAPLTTRQKFSLAVRRAFDPVSLIGVSLGAGVEQATNAYPGFGQGGEGYAKRWGALFADGRTSEILTRAVFPSFFHEDPRYFYQGSGSAWSRIRHAVGSAFVARSDSGHFMPDYSYFLGDVSAGALSNLYYPASSRGAGLVFTNAVIGFGGRAGQNLIHEFLFKRLTKNVPADGKPGASSENR